LIFVLVNETVPLNGSLWTKVPICRMYPILTSRLCEVRVGIFSAASIKNLTKDIARGVHALIPKDPFAGQLRQGITKL
jgi:hypothetical protein